VLREFDEPVPRGASGPDDSIADAPLD
jgi:hypothetical protein